MVLVETPLFERKRGEKWPGPYLQHPTSISYIRFTFFYIFFRAYHIPCIHRSHLFFFLFPRAYLLCFCTYTFLIYLTLIHTPFFFPFYISTHTHTHTYTHRHIHGLSHLFSSLPISSLLVSPPPFPSFPLETMYIRIPQHSSHNT